MLFGALLASSQGQEWDLLQSGKHGNAHGWERAASGYQVIQSKSRQVDDYVRILSFRDVNFFLMLVSAYAKFGI